MLPVVLLLEQLLKTLLPGQPNHSTSCRLLKLTLLLWGFVLVTFNGADLVFDQVLVPLLHLVGDVGEWFTDLFLQAVDLGSNTAITILHSIRETGANVMEAATDNLEISREVIKDVLEKIQKSMLLAATTIKDGSSFLSELVATNVKSLINSQSVKYFVCYVMCLITKLGEFCKSLILTSVTIFQATRSNGEKFRLFSSLLKMHGGGEAGARLLSKMVRGQLCT